MPKLPVAPSARVKSEFEAIARRYLHFDTLEERRSDSLDFREVAVWGVEAALTEAYELGVKAGKASRAKPKANPHRRRNPANSDVLRTIGEFYRGGLISHAQYTRFDAAAKAVKTAAGAAELKALVVRTAQHR